MDNKEQEIIKHINQKITSIKNNFDYFTVNDKRIKEFGDGAGIDLDEYNKSKKKFIVDRSDLVVLLSQENNLNIFCENSKENNMGNLLFLLKDSNLLEINNSEKEFLKKPIQKKNIYAKEEKAPELNISFSDDLAKKTNTNVNFLLGVSGKQYLDFQEGKKKLIDLYSFKKNFDNYQKLADVFVAQFGNDGYSDALDKMFNSIKNGELIPNENGFVFSCNVKGKATNVQVLMEQDKIISLEVPALKFGFKKPIAPSVTNEVNKGMKI